MENWKEEKVNAPKKGLWQRLAALAAAAALVLSLAGCSGLPSVPGGSADVVLKELNNYPLISLSDESMTRAFYRQFFLDHGAVLKPDTEAATTDQMLTLVKSELGIAFLPQTMAQDALARGEIVQLHLQEIIPQRSICLVYDHHRPLNTAARKFQQMLTKAAPKCPEHR